MSLTALACSDDSTVASDSTTDSNTTSTTTTTETSPSVSSLTDWLKNALESKANVKLVLLI